jgi:hypothetical protein
MRLDKFTEKAQEALEGKFSESDTLEVDASRGELTFTKASAAVAATVA